MNGERAIHKTGAGEARELEGNYLRDVHLAVQHDSALVGGDHHHEHRDRAGRSRPA